MDTNRSVGVIIKNTKNQILMLDRIKEPLGWACVAGHMEVGETPEEAIKREIKEESGLSAKELIELFNEEVIWNNCPRHNGHYWYVFEAMVETDDFTPNKEAKEMKWVEINNLKDLNLEPVWEYWFKKLKLI